MNGALVLLAGWTCECGRYGRLFEGASEQTRAAYVDARDAHLAECEQAA